MRGVSLVTDNPFSFKVRERLQQDRNTMFATTGDPRSGKTESQKDIGRECDIHGRWRYPQTGSTKIVKVSKQEVLATIDGGPVIQRISGKYYDSDYSCKSHMAFLPQDYMNLIRKLEAGHVADFDEPGAEWSNRRFMSLENMLLNATHITFGSKLINVGWAVPVLKMQDLSSRMLLKFYFEMYPGGLKGMARFYRNWVDKYTGKYGRTRLGACWFAPAFPDKPEEEKEYGEMKRQYQDVSYEHYWLEFQKRDRKEEKEEKVKVKEADEKIETREERMIRRNKEYTDMMETAVSKVLRNSKRYQTSRGWNVALVAMDCHLNRTYAYDVVKLVKRQLEKK